MSTSPWTRIENADFAHFHSKETLLNDLVFKALLGVMGEEGDAVAEMPQLSALEDAEGLFHTLESLRTQGRSLVLVVPEDQFPLFGEEEWPLVPTFGEALDYLEMERIQRELGF